MYTVAVFLFAVCAVLAVSSVSGGAILCERSKGYIHCPPGQRIAVHYAYYGRTHDRSICPHPATSNQNCRASGSFNKIKNACHNKQVCYLAANNGVFGDPCVGTYKYIDVNFSCVQAYKNSRTLI
ncbi:L-rhamnose-binding lectin ELEL-1-like [Mya arenaria]|uniref:L-rhamnose-binding lectin ELEL-1-like n=1 Tax=Mya arenaria TaxID=6604 RepID=UPI0022E661BB|nr:L-rhamnose-binding lectin ELEL-1-like [Mya arenaria]